MHVCGEGGEAEEQSDLLNSCRISDGYKIMASGNSFNEIIEKKYN